MSASHAQARSDAAVRGNGAVLRPVDQPVVANRSVSRRTIACMPVPPPGLITLGLAVLLVMHEPDAGRLRRLDQPPPAEPAVVEGTTRDSAAPPLQAAVTLPPPPAPASPAPPGHMAQAQPESSAGRRSKPAGPSTPSGGGKARRHRDGRTAQASPGGRPPCRPKRPQHAPGTGTRRCRACTICRRQRPVRNGAAGNRPPAPSPTAQSSNPVRCHVKQWYRRAARS